LRADTDLGRARLAVALDAGPDEARAILGAVGDEVDIAKIGLTLYGLAGPELVRELVADVPVFLDLKLHDIPAQVAGAAEAAAGLGVSYLTVHAGGGEAMIAAGVAATASTRTRILAVTVLTSLDDHDLDAMGVGDGAEKQVLRLAELALAAGAHGLVCSPLEISALRGRFGPDPILLVPGIRPAGAESGDQKRTMTPAEAAAAGADIVVVGRPITGSPDPSTAARAIAAELRGGRG